MTIPLREDLTYILLKKINEGNGNRGESEIKQAARDYIGRDVTETDLLGHLDYLNQQGFIKAEFTGEPYGGVELAPPVITFKEAELTDKGQKLLNKFETNPSRSLLHQGSAIPIASKDMPFLEKVMVNGHLEDIFDARDITEVIFRTMRDMMSDPAADRVEAELHKDAVPTDDKTLKTEIAELWRDTNPLVHFLSRIRPPLIIRPETFIFRIEQEAALPPGIHPETVIKAVFSATKDELSPERIQEVAGFLPGEVRQMWEEA